MLATSLVLWLAAGLDAEARDVPEARIQTEHAATRGARVSKKTPSASKATRSPTPRPQPATASAARKPAPRPPPTAAPATPRAAPRPAPAAPTATPRAAPRPAPAPAPAAAPRSQPVPRAEPTRHDAPIPTGTRPAGQVGPAAARSAPGAPNVARPVVHTAAVPGRTIQQVDVGPAPSRAGLRSFTGPTNLTPGDASAPGTAGRPSGRPAHRDPTDDRYSRPTSDSVRPAPYAHGRVPVVTTYRAYYTRWYCHPWYRYRYSTYAVVWFDFDPYPWYDWWVPPARWGWSWVPGGYYGYSYWNPGYWAPIGPAPVGYVYVPGWWEQDAYVEGYWRAEARDSWEWVDGYYLDDGTVVRGHWAPTGVGPEGYTWEPGFWDGEEYVDGFWRPEFRSDYTWVSAYYDGDGVFHSGYWMPQEARPGFVWIPGWFDGNEWVAGYWLPEEQVSDEALDEWEPPEGARDGWDSEKRPEDYVPTPDAPAESQIIEERKAKTGDVPLAIPVVPEPAPE